MIPVETGLHVPEMLADHRIHGRPIGAVADIDSELADIVERRACFVEQGRKILESEVGLGARVRDRAC